MKMLILFFTWQKRYFFNRKDISRNLGQAQPEPLFDSEKIIAVVMKGYTRKKIRKFGLNKP